MLQINYCNLKSDISTFFLHKEQEKIDSELISKLDF